MASAAIFTFEPDPPRVASPWAAATPPPGRSPHGSQSPSDSTTTECSIAFNGSILPVLEDSSIARIEAEPQEGPVEYKLHLLLRQRRSFTYCSTRRQISGSLRRTETHTPISVARSVPDARLLGTIPPPLSAVQSRNHRLEQLTSQMLWRLQQSSPNHTSSSNESINLLFPDESQKSGSVLLERLFPGLEDSNGALYELGVADDGELIGLAKDEMEESLHNLRVMAASLGCRVEVQRVVAIGSCEWVEDAGASQQITRKSKLLVAEAFIRPDQHFDRRRPSPHPEELINSNGEVSLTNAIDDGNQKVEQLRVSLMGATTFGKSSLLGTLSTGTLDNGKGLSRLSLLKHKHEHESGETSSITQQLIGYHDDAAFNGTRTSTHALGSTDHSSWTDILTFAGSSEAGRIVLLTDSAGHPRFHRTTVRGLVGWDPHYTLLCVPANLTEDASRKIGAPSLTKDASMSAVRDWELTIEHIHLCLALELPLLVVITKFDLATKTGIKSVITKVGSMIHGAGRKYSIVADTPGYDEELGVVPSADLTQITKDVNSLEISPTSVVPIILTSAVRGNGLNKLHAFLRELPVPTSSSPPAGTPGTLFYIENLYKKASVRSRSDEPTIVGGLLRHGTLSIGDELLLGPYPADSTSDDSDSGSGGPSRHSSSAPTSRSFPGAFCQQLSNTNLRSRSRSRSYLIATEWRRVRIVSLRNLRRPIHTLHTDQVGTIGLLPVHGQMPISSPAIHRIRKGMVLANGEPQAKRVISVRCTGSNALAANMLGIGSNVVICTASVRASSKVISVSQEGGGDTRTKPEADDADDDDDGFGFGLDIEEDTVADDPSNDFQTHPAATMVTFQFITSREFIEADAKVLAMPGGGPGLTGSKERGEKGLAGLEGFVGRAVEG
ncbi:hypothetical protein CC80DRAFT_60187 [Byssothecium circinans]|uniref:Tr-type G domain-containing protein n=1 Tax=Byssothecium circinans TaxID=147558 RepID=A0A6A5U0M1_9PLEO|nr:hypothetical protein CC80DRAFT_60187 [Byssothecium circinans]